MVVCSISASRCVSFVEYIFTEQYVSIAVIGINTLLRY